MHELVLTPPRGSDRMPGLHNVLPGMESIVPSVSDGEILNRFQTLVAAVFILTQQDLSDFCLKAMHFEYPPYKEREFAKMNDPIYSIYLLADGIAHATRSHATTGNMILDVFSRQYEDGKFNWNTFHQNGLDRSQTNSYSRSTIDYSSFRTNFTMTEVRPPARKTDLSKIVSGFLHANLHLIADGFPYTPLNIFREHDHRKGMLFRFKSGEEMAMLQTFNFDSPLDLDCSLVSFDPAIVSTLRTLLTDPVPHNTVIEGEDWKIYQDGSQDLDPLEPITSSPIMSRVHQMLQDESTKTVRWTSQFLPDIESLQEIDEKLRVGSLENIEVFAPHPKMWRVFYRLSGGMKSKVLAEQISRKYPGRFLLHYTKNRYLHAKTITLNDEVLLLGSHNFNRTLVRARTSEIMLEQKMSPITKNSLEHFYDEMYAETEKFH